MSFGSWMSKRLVHCEGIVNEGSSRLSGEDRSNVIFVENQETFISKSSHERAISSLLLFAVMLAELEKRTKFSSIFIF
jgi:hypothetical protein